MEEINIYNLLITFLTTIVGTVFGGIVTLLVNKKFEIARLRLNNIDEMSKIIAPLLQNYIGVLNSVCEVLEANEYREEICKQDDIVMLFGNSLNEVNAAVNIYEIELSDMLEFYENLLMKSKEFIEEFEKVDIINDDKSYYWKFLPQAKILVDMVATFSEEVSELKRKMLNGKLNRYWKRIFIRKKRRIELTIINSKITNLIRFL